jgi:hypothetical protein
MSNQYAVNRAASSKVCPIVRVQVCGGIAGGRLRAVRIMLEHEEGYPKEAGATRRPSSGEGGDDRRRPDKSSGHRRMPRRKPYPKSRQAFPGASSL